MRVAITGGLGFIGSHLAERFVEAGDDVLIIDDCRGRVVANVEGAAVRHISAGFWSVSEPGSFDLVVHAAAPVGPGAVTTLGGQIGPDIIHETRFVALMCAAKGIPLVNISSSEVYGGTPNARPVEDDPIGHMGRFTARSEYGLGKALAENMLANMRRLRHVSIRPFNTAGPRQSAAKGFVLPTFIEQAKSGQALTLYEPAARRSLTSVHDFNRFIVDHWRTALALQETERTPINVGNPENECTMLELAHAVGSAHITATGSDVKIVEVDPRSVWGDAYAFFGQRNGVKLPTCDIAHALGWRPTWSLHDIVDDAYRRST